MTPSQQVKVLAAGFLLHPVVAATQTSSPQWTPVRTIRTRPPADSQAWNPDTLVLRNGRRLEAGPYEVSYIGQLPRSHGAPYLILSGTGCYNCDDMTHIYVVPADGGQLGTFPPGYYYPGAIRPAESDTVFFRSRLFLGTCLDSANPVLVWFQDERDSTAKWHRSAFVVRIQNDSMREGRLTGLLPPIEATLRRVRTGSCREIHGLDQSQY
jgi:hypothetical protein